MKTSHPRIMYYAKIRRIPNARVYQEWLSATNQSTQSATMKIIKNQYLFKNPIELTYNRGFAGWRMNDGLSQARLILSRKMDPLKFKSQRRMQEQSENRSRSTRGRRFESEVRTLRTNLEGIVQITSRDLGQTRTTKRIEEQIHSKPNFY